MSLVRLLTAGKSLVGLKDGQVRYQMGDPRSMPRFGSGKNPFQRKGRAQTEGDASVGQSGAASVDSQGCANTGLVVEAVGSSHSVTADERPPIATGACEPRRISEVCGLDNSGSLRKTSDTPQLPGPPCTLSETSSKTLSSPTVADSPAATPSGRRWLSSLKSLFGLRPLRSDRKPGPARAISQPVQGELRLDNVKVLRNDLSDTDLEIVTKAPPRQPPMSSPKVKAESAVPNETAWERVTTLFGGQK